MSKLTALLSNIRDYAYEVAGGKPKVIMGEMMYANPLQRLFGQKSFDLYNPNELLSVRGMRVIDKMLMDDQVKAALHLKKLAIVSPGYEIMNPEGVEGDYPPTLFIREVFEELDGTFAEVAKNMLTCLDYGFSVTEKVWEVDRPIESLDGKKMIVLSALKTRSPQYVIFQGDGFGNISGVKQESTIIDIDKLIIYTHEGRFGNPYGTPDLHAAYRAWWIKDNAYKWMAMLLERMGIPPIFFLYSNAYTPADVASLKQVVASMQAGTGGAIPRPTKKEDLEAWAPELADNVSGVFIPTIEHLNKSISRAILVPALLGLSDQGSVGALARSQTEFEVFMMVVDGIRSYLGSSIIQEQIIEPLIDLNFPAGTKQPVFAWKPLKDEVKTELYDTWNNMVLEGVVTAQEEDEAAIRNKFKMPPLSDAGKAKRAAAEKMKQDQASAELKATQNPQPQPVGGPARVGKPAGSRFSSESRDVGRYVLFSPEVLFPSHIDYDAVEEQLNALQQEAVGRVRQALTESRDDLVDSLRRKGGGVDAKFANDVTLRRWSRVQDALAEMLRAASDAGQHDAAGEISDTETHAAAKPARGMTPNQLVQYLNQKTIYVSGVLKDSILKDVKNELLSGVKNGKTLGDIIDGVTEAFLPWLGDAKAIDDPEVAQPYRTETVVRTNLTDAYNQGRLNRFRDPKLAPFVVGVQYSAILDERTTPVCQFLHGKVFKPNDPALDQLTPPNHFNCRSMLVPLMVDADLSSADFITAGEIGEAKDLAGKGFLSDEFNYDPEKHPHYPAGTSKGGEFAPKDGGDPGQKKYPENTHTKIRKLIKAGETLPGNEVSKAMRGVIIYKEPFAQGQVAALNNYVASSSGLNNALRMRGGDLSKFPQDGTGVKSIKALDSMFQSIKNFALPLTVHRGIPASVVNNLKVGDTFTDHGYVSTTFARSVAGKFSGGTRLEIRLPKGFKFVSIPSMIDHGLKISHAHSEAEIILPRSTVFRIRSIKQIKGGPRIVKVEAIASSVQGVAKTLKKAAPASTIDGPALNEAELFAMADDRIDHFTWKEGDIVMVNPNDIESPFTEDDYKDEGDEHQ